MTSETVPVNDLKAAARPDWGVPLVALVCDRCDWTFFYPRPTQDGASAPASAAASGARCPHCQQAGMTKMEGQVAELPHTLPPELFLPFRLNASTQAQQVESFARGIPFAPRDLTPQNLQSRLRPVFLPAWLVDTQVQALWRAEAGFNYQVVSHQDRYDQNAGGWASQEVREARVRWEPRLGRLVRRYENVLAPALDADPVVRQALGDVSIKEAQAYQADAIQQAFIRLPNRKPEDAWNEAVLSIQAAAAKECQAAAGADHIRQFQWQPEFSQQNWTLLLLPMYASYYLDDERHPQPVFLNGRTGKISGTRRASMQRAQQTALVMLGIAGLVLLLSLLGGLFTVMLPAVLPLVMLGVILALLLAAGAAIPVVVAWQFNRSR